MIAVLVRLQWMTLKGRVVRSIRLLRQPKYLVGSVVGVGWIGLWVVRPLLHSQRRASAGDAVEPVRHGVHAGDSPARRALRHGLPCRCPGSCRGDGWGSRFASPS